eukprot:2031151-Prymnesium_polylepis.1
MRAVTDVTGLAAGGTTAVRAGAHVSPHVLKGSESRSPCSSRPRRTAAAPSRSWTRTRRQR